MENKEAIQMLHLKLPTDPRWVNIVEKNIEEILTDHAYCEQKAASSAISFIIGFPEYSELVAAMSDLAIEEMSHFKMVHDLMVERGLHLGRERKDEYVHKLRFYFPKGGSRVESLINYRKLMISEAGHYTMFLNFARQYGDRKKVDAKWQELLDFEKQVMKDLSVKETMHG